MNASFIQILIRHGLASLGGFFAANHITGSTTSSIVVGLVTLAIPVFWSWVSKVLKYDDSSAKAEGITHSEIFRTLLGAIVSQGITALSVYFAIDADNPELLLGAAANAAASKFGLQQKLTGMPALKVLMACLCVLSLSSCANNPEAKQALINFGKRVALTVGETAVVVAQVELATKTQAWLDAKTAGDPVKEALARATMMGAQQALAAAAKALANEKAKLDKQPVNVTAAKQPQAAPASNFPPPCEEPDVEDGPGCMRLANRIPRHGMSVAFMLSTVNVSN